KPRRRANNRANHASLGGSRAEGPLPHGDEFMKHFEPFLSRRRLLHGGLALGAAAFLTPGAFAEELARTPRLTEGPFYPDKLPLDTDNDLVIVNNSLTPAVGEITHLMGRVCDISGSPIKDAVVEIWQVDNKGVYI